ncbi:MAG: LysR family transcriptional regulator [Rhodospirillales bacterium]|jgi:DNA-binding transcriptional LysR family regulator|nr:LysR family transcriptional regulator [Rhodospirillales bacterium]
MNRLPDLDYLRSLLSVARHGSISGASEELHRSQSTISIRISQLESALGHSLFRRHARGVSLTSEGQIVVNYAHRILDLETELCDSLDMETMPELIRLGLAPDYAVSRLPKILREFTEFRQKIRMEVTVAPSIELNELMQNNEIDLALAAVEFMSQTPLTSWTEPLLWVASRDYVVDLSQPLPIICQGREEPRRMEHPWEKRIFDRLSEAGLDWRIVYSTTTVESKAAAVEAGLGVSNLTRKSMRPAMRVLGELDGLPPPLSAEFGFFTPDETPNSAITALMRRLMTALNT